MLRKLHVWSSFRPCSPLSAQHLAPNTGQIHNAIEAEDEDGQGGAHLEQVQVHGGARDQEPLPDPGQERHDADGRALREDRQRASRRGARL